ncbi:hypothetical protein BCR33DRAFT_715498 [Rhizoclosmatium globosum]|uniref:RNA polymerase II assembly factor Rtp1 C-terminal domain-containing protein n=1 Tax=Rhizoclosmatium globosum TaxID=329046 RepID=A0A1Y2CH72_9FUNG|nr:hypothetical protein BCR33DRAFT_715498 [Rhizoclosmatium globosum]|eukprot:ORY46400.1 hypothetical protein BCR33DRAFT_715498 [Rhizoclosmatium globosum]
METCSVLAQKIDIGALTLLVDRLVQAEATGLPTTYSQNINETTSKHVYILACLWSLQNAERIEAENSSANSVQSYKTISTLVEIVLSWGYVKDRKLEVSWIKYFIINKYLQETYSAYLSLIASAESLPSKPTDSWTPPNKIPILAYTQFSSLLQTGHIDLPKSMTTFLHILSLPSPAPLRLLCGRFLTSLLLHKKGIESLLSTFLTTLDDPQDPTTDIGAALSSIARICSSPQEYFEVIGPQIVTLIETLERGSVMFQAAVYLAAWEAVYFGCACFWVCAVSFPCIAGDLCDLDGNPVIITEEACAKAVDNLARVLSHSEPSYAVMDALQPCFLPLYKMFELQQESPILAKEGSIKDMLVNLLRLNSPAKTQLVLTQMVLFRGESVSGYIPVAKVGSGGGIQFVKMRQEVGIRGIQNPDAFVEFLIGLENEAITSGVFLDLLEEYIKTSTVSDDQANTEPENLTMIRILMSLIEKFGANLVKGTRHVIDLVKNLIVNSQSVDTGCLLLCLTILKTLLTEFGIRLPRLVAVLQTLEHHSEKGIQTVSTMRRLILLKNTNASDASSGTLVTRELKTNLELLFAKSMLELSDPLLPIRAHGIDQLRKLILSRDPVGHENLSTILCSFIYLHAVSGLSALTDVYPQDSLQEIVSRYSSAEYDLDYRLRIGEVASKTIQRSGQVFPKYGTLRGSAIVLLGVVAETAPFPLLPFIHQILDYIENTLILETKDAVMRQGAVLALLTLIRGMDGTLKIVNEMDPDELTRYNAGIALEELRDRAGVFVTIL